MTIAGIKAMSQIPSVTQGRKEYKDEQLLARLIGAAVLLAVAVIVLPFVLDGAGSQREYEYAETFPVQPQRPIVEKSYSSRQPLPEPPQADDLPVITTAAAPEFAPGAQNGPVADTSPSIPRSENTGSVAAAALPTGSDSQEIPVGFNIQVASFVKENNALKLLNRLRSENLPAYINRVEGKKRAILRVFAGPISSQIDALALKNRIDRSYRVESIMVTRN